MAQTRKNNETFVPVSILDGETVNNRRFTSMEIFHNGVRTIVTGKDLPDHILISTNFRTEHGNVLKVVQKKKKESLPWTTADYALMFGSLNFALWIMSMI